ncbi:YmaF family protein [Geosporobacter subterraneus DSM 17957]|uniref:YmaF family protein n=1 Tax=Geosporobacter subterraneus DSM 17957 TaxID=1121919 RepID=A0A1M6IJ82_9FIRM|nr:YmaF family protein [Geosporobacter subterraneus]SHJ34453.1 YmaF family protein [Geosporobacter subterraneus DSM 17957]
MYNPIEGCQFSHIHEYRGTTTVDDQHTHNYYGYTGGAIPSAGSHVHYYQGRTTVDDRHSHEYGGYTGPFYIYSSKLVIFVSYRRKKS